MHRPAEICNLELATHVKEQILGLDVAVNHVLRVAVVERGGERANVLPQHGTTFAGVSRSQKGFQRKLCVRRASAHAGV